MWTVNGSNDNSLKARRIARTTMARVVLLTSSGNASDTKNNMDNQDRDSSTNHNSDSYSNS